MKKYFFILVLMLKVWLGDGEINTGIVVHWTPDSQAVVRLRNGTFLVVDPHFIRNSKWVEVKP